MPPLPPRAPQVLKYKPSAPHHYPIVISLTYQIPPHEWEEYIKAREAHKEIDAKNVAKFGEPKHKDKPREGPEPHVQTQLTYVEVPCIAL